MSITEQKYWPWISTLLNVICRSTSYYISLFSSRLQTISQLCPWEMVPLHRYRVGLTSAYMGPHWLKASAQPLHHWCFNKISDKSPTFSLYSGPIFCCACWVAPFFQSHSLQNSSLSTPCRRIIFFFQCNGKPESQMLWESFFLCLFSTCLDTFQVWQQERAFCISMS